MAPSLIHRIHSTIHSILPKSDISPCQPKKLYFQLKFYQAIIKLIDFDITNLIEWTFFLSNHNIPFSVRLLLIIHIMQYTMSPRLSPLTAFFYKAREKTPRPFTMGSQRTRIEWRFWNDLKMHSRNLRRILKFHFDWWIICLCANGNNHFAVLFEFE